MFGIHGVKGPRFGALFFCLLAPQKRKGSVKEFKEDKTSTKGNEKKQKLRIIQLLSSNYLPKNNESPLKGGTLNPKKKSFIPYGLVSSVFSSILTCLSNQMTRDTSQIKELELYNLGLNLWYWSQGSGNKMKVTPNSSLLIEPAPLSQGYNAVQ